MKRYTDSNPVFSKEVTLIEPTDTNHADNLNPSIEQTFANTLVNHQEIESVKKSKATQSVNGLMGAADKKKLDEIEEKATANSPSTTKPKANGTAAAGSESGYARGDHVHPLQTSVSGNAGTSDKWTTARKINGMSVQGDEDRANYGSCSTAAATATKVVACTGFALATGSEITVKFTVTNTAANPTLNVNGTGAKPVYYRGAAIAAGYLAVNRTYTFRYNGTQYELVGDLDTNTTYGNMGAATADATGKAGLVPAPPKGAQEKYLRGDGTWQTPPMNTGPQGPKGDTGAAAGFGTPTATVDANVGTPSVTVTASGSNTAKVFKFEFKNLKGAKGDKGDKGADGAETADASASVKGLVNTGAQTFGGDKTFNNAVQVNGGLRTKAAVEIFGATPYIDFHFNNSDADYTSRIVEVLSGVLRCIGKWQCGANLQMWTDAEGANIQMVAPDGSKYEVDTYGNGLRIYSINSNGTVANANILYSDLLGNISFSGKILANGSATSDECVRNIQLTTTDPGENVVTTARNGSLIAVYE